MKGSKPRVTAPEMRPKTLAPGITPWRRLFPAGATRQVIVRICSLREPRGWALPQFMRRSQNTRCFVPSFLPRLRISRAELSALYAADPKRCERFARGQNRSLEVDAAAGGFQHDQTKD